MSALWAVGVYQSQASATGAPQPAAASRHLRCSYRCPDPDKDERAFVEFLLSLGAEWEGGVLFPMGDEALVAVSRRKADLSRRYRVIAADWNMVRVLIEKRHTYEIAEQHGIPCPRMRLTRDEGEAIAFARDVRSLPAQAIRQPRLLQQIPR